MLRVCCYPHCMVFVFICADILVIQNYWQPLVAQHMLAFSPESSWSHNCLPMLDFIILLILWLSHFLELPCLSSSLIPSLQHQKDSPQQQNSEFECCIGIKAGSQGTSHLPLGTTVLGPYSQDQRRCFLQQQSSSHAHQHPFLSC